MHFETEKMTIKKLGVERGWKGTFKVEKLGKDKRPVEAFIFNISQTL